MSNRREFSRRLKLACEPERKRVEQLRARINYECHTRGISEAELRRAKDAARKPHRTIEKFHLTTLNA